MAASRSSLSPLGGLRRQHAPPSEAGALHRARHGASGADPPVGLTASFLDDPPPLQAGVNGPSTLEPLTFVRPDCRARPCKDDGPDARWNLPPEPADAELQPCETIALSHPPCVAFAVHSPLWLNWQPCPSLFGAAARGEPSALALGLSSVWSCTGGKRFVQHVKRQEGPPPR